MGQRESRPGAALRRALLAALALSKNGCRQSAEPLLQEIVYRLHTPRGRDHFWLAAALAMQGRSHAALAELEASPPGRVRLHAPLLMRDPRFETLRGSSAFRREVHEHLKEIARQHDSYVSHSTRVAAATR